MIRGSGVYLRVIRGSLFSFVKKPNLPRAAILKQKHGGTIMAKVVKVIVRREPALSGGSAARSHEVHRARPGE